MIQLLKRIISKCLKKVSRRKHTRFIEKLRSKGVDIGTGCRFWSYETMFIDTQRPHMLHIGNYVKLTRNVTILTHDYSRSVLLMCEHQNIGEARKTWIGDNVFIGQNAIILMGTHIGNNTIVGAGSVVTGQFPDDVVIAGNPAKVICTIQDYADKRRAKTLGEAVEFARTFYEKHGRYPTVYQMTDAFTWLYLPHNRETAEKYDMLFRMGGIDYEQSINDFVNSSPQFESYESFIEYVDTCSK